MTGEHVLRNRRTWDARHSDWFGARARDQWVAQPHWGVWARPQAELPVFPDRLAGLDVVDLGCGTGYVCAWVARAGGRPVGVDNSPRQLATARALQGEFGLAFPLLHADAERLPLADRCADLAISEHGAVGWCDPYRWIPEAARILRPGGQLVFVRNSTLLVLCTGDDGPTGPQLRRDYADVHRVESSDGGVNFHLPTGPMLRLLRDNGLVVDDIVEDFAPADATSCAFDYVDVGWGRRWPSVEVWKASRTG